MAVEEESVVNVILFTFFGALGALIFGIFVKRQILRFTLKSSSRPHAPIGYGAPKHIQEEILRYIERVQEVKYEPKLLEYTPETATGQVNGSTSLYYRMRTMDSVALLDEELAKYNREVRDASIAESLIRAQHNIREFPARQPGRDNLREYLLALRAGPLQEANIDLIVDFMNAYEHARHDPTSYEETQFKAYMDLLGQLTQCIKNKTADLHCRHGLTRSSVPSGSTAAGKSTARSRGSGSSSSAQAVAAMTTRQHVLTTPRDETLPLVEPLNEETDVGVVHLGGVGALSGASRVKATSPGSSVASTGKTDRGVASQSTSSGGVGGASGLLSHSVLKIKSKFKYKSMSDETML